MGLRRWTSKREKLSVQAGFTLTCATQAEGGPLAQMPDELTAASNATAVQPCAQQCGQL